MSLKWKVTGLGALVVALATAAALLPVGEWATAIVAYVQGAAGIALFGLVYLAAPLVLLPTSVLTLGAGFLYGPLGGMLLVSPLSVAVASIAFLLGRTLARRWVQRRVANDARFVAGDRAAPLSVPGLADGWRPC